MDRRKLRRKRLEDLVPTDPGTLGWWALRYLEDLAERGYSPHTIRGTGIYLRIFLTWCSDREITDPAAVSVPVIERYRRHLFHWRTPEGRRLTFVSQYDRLGGVRRFFRWLVKRGVLEMSPAATVDPPRVERRLPKAVLSASEAERVLSQPDVHTALGLRDRAMLETLYATGLRRQELVALSIGDVDIDRGVIMVRQGKGKKDRMVPLSERAAAWIEKYAEEVRPLLSRQADPKPLFLSTQGGAIGGLQVSKRVRLYVEASGIPKQGSCHLFRHTVATLLLEGGAELRYVQELLGHADISTTQVYTRVAIGRLKEVYEKSHPGAKLRQRHPAARSVDSHAAGGADLAEETPLDPRAALLAAIQAEAAEELEESERRQPAS